MKSCLVRAWISIAFVCVFSITRLPAEEPAARTAAKILDSAGLPGGIAVQLGCGDGRLTAALAADGRWTVQALDQDADQVAVARSYLKSQGLYGRVSVEPSCGSTLPYTDNLINLVLVSGVGCQVSEEEIQRVLAPGGVAVSSADTRNPTPEILFRQPWPDDIDEWSHFLHDASNNAVADDQVVGPPRSLQWVASPLWLRSHETPSGVQSPVSAGGRLFYFFDEGLIGITDERLPDRWSLICRDAFNGRLLWRKPLESWGWRDWSYDRYAGKDWTTLRAARTDVPAENQRRIVADGDRVYATLSYRAPLSILDATTGDLIATVDETAGTSEILASDGVVVTYSQEMPTDLAQRRGEQDSVTAGLVAVDGRTGKVLWQNATGTIRSLALAIDNGRVIYVSGDQFVALGLNNGETLWSVAPPLAPRTLLTVDDVVVMQSGGAVVAVDATDGSLLWQKNKLPGIGGGEAEDLFVVDGLVYRGMLSVNEELKPVGKSPNSLVIGWGLRTGEEKKRIAVMNLRSPEHHHRCYRNKATTRYLISSFEGAEFLDFQGENHGQNNWIRGACKNGMTPCNGMLYVPPDQCFCQPGAKLLGYTAVKAAPAKPFVPVADTDRLTPGPAFGKTASSASPASGLVSSQDWPTFRHDAARSGSTPAAVKAAVTRRWQTKLGGKLTAPVAAGGKVFVAASDAHTVYALDSETGQIAWEFTTGGRVDSPPTIHDGLVLLGSKDGRVYCLRADDGQLVWQFLAAPLDLRVGAFDQLESAWPVHGSVLVADGVAYFTAGRSTYLDGGIRVYGLNPATGQVLHQGLLEGPHRSVDDERDLAFYILGANSDVLVSEGGFLYMRQKKLTPDLQEIPVDVLCSKGSQDVGLHIFSTAGLLDDSWYNRTFWMYSKRWPGFQLANQASKSGQLLVVDEEHTYALRVFYRRNTHSPMFFPGTDGYLIFADANANEPQIVGEAGAQEPLRWLPQSDYSRGRGDEMRALDSQAFGQDKGIGYTRAEPPLWMQWLPVRVRAMVKAGDSLFVAGAPDVLNEDDPFAPFEDRTDAALVALSAADGKPLSQVGLDAPPVFDGLIAAHGWLYVSQTDGSLVCLGE